MPSLDEAVDSIRTREDFVSFVHHLLEDLRMNPDDWENDTLGSYIDALAAWVEGMDGFYLNVGEPFPERPDWRTFGQILLAARIYE